MADIVMADIGIAEIVMACIVTACVIMAYIVMAYMGMAFVGTEAPQIRAPKFYFFFAGYMALQKEWYRHRSSVEAAERARCHNYICHNCIGHMVRSSRPPRGPGAITIYAITT